jgi:hypothetical protein
MPETIQIFSAGKAKAPAQFRIDDRRVHIPGYIDNKILPEAPLKIEDAPYPSFSSGIVCLKSFSLPYYSYNTGKRSSAPYVPAERIDMQFLLCKQIQLPASRHIEIYAPVTMEAGKY